MKIWENLPKQLLLFTYVVLSCCSRYWSTICLQNNIMTYRWRSGLLICRPSGKKQQKRCDYTVRNHIYPTYRICKSVYVNNRCRCILHLILKNSFRFTYKENVNCQYYCESIVKLNKSKFSSSISLHISNYQCSSICIHIHSYWQFIVTTFLQAHSSSTWFATFITCDILEN